jgi:hypothetical protein
MGDIARRHTKGQPILIGTTSVQASEALSKLLTDTGVPHEVCVWLCMCLHMAKNRLCARAFAIYHSYNGWFLEV